jgi:hypothetical protein
MEDPNVGVRVFVVAGSYCVASDSELTGPVGIWLVWFCWLQSSTNEDKPFFGISYDER